MRALSIGIVLVALPAWAQISPPSPETPEAIQTFRYGDRWAQATRLPTRVDLPYQPIVLRFADLDLEVSAGIDATAIVQIDADDPRAVHDILTLHGLRIVRPLMVSAELWLAAADGEDGLDIAARLAAVVGPHSGLADVSPNLWLAHTKHAADPPNDPRFAGQWYFDRINMLDAWELTTGDPARTVVIVDDGCDLDHPDLINKMDPGLDVFDNDDDPSYLPAAAGNEHGTACAGLVAADTDNNLGIAGGCPECRLRCVRLLGARGQMLPVTADVDAFEFALAVDADVVSNSWGFVDQIAVPPALEIAINNVYNNGRGGMGALVLFAVGNDSWEIGDHELLGVEGVLGIGAINNYDEKTSFTNYGNSVDLVAPAGTLTTDIAGPDGAESGDYFTGFGGTSSACPVAAGVAGLLVSAAPDKTAAELYDLMILTARTAPYAEFPDAHDPIYGWGIIDPAPALRALGLTPPEPEIEEEGCDCAAAGAPLWLAMLPLLWWRRRL